MAEPSPEALQRLRFTIAGALGSVVALTLLSWAIGFWPYELVYQTQADWFGLVGLRATFTGIFVIYCGILIGVLLPVAVVLNLYRKVRGD